MDWGLAKVLPEGGVADDDRAGTEPAERDGHRDGAERLGRRTPRRPAACWDAGVHGAGAGRRRGRAGRRAGRRLRRWARSSARSSPASRRTPGGRRRRDPSQGDAGRHWPTPSARLDACGADAELIALARDCLAASRRTGRGTPASVADEWGSTGATLERRAGDRARAARRRLARAEEALVRSMVERTRRRRTLALAASLLLLAGASAAGDMRCATAAAGPRARDAVGAGRARGRRCSAIKRGNRATTRQKWTELAGPRPRRPADLLADLEVAEAQPPGRGLVARRSSRRADGGRPRPRAGRQAGRTSASPGPTTWTARPATRPIARRSGTRGSTSRR